MEHLLGTPPVTVWGGCQDVASSLMTLMHSAVQEELVGLLKDQTSMYLNC